MALDPQIINEIQILHKENIGEGRVPSYLATHITMQQGPFRMIATGFSKSIILENLSALLDEGYSKSEALEEMGIESLEFEWSLKYFCREVEDITSQLLVSIPESPSERQES